MKVVLFCFTILCCIMVNGQVANTAIFRFCDRGENGEWRSIYNALLSKKSCTIEILDIGLISESPCLPQERSLNMANLYKKHNVTKIIYGMRLISTHMEARIADLKSDGRFMNEALIQLSFPSSTNNFYNDFADKINRFICNNPSIFDNLSRSKTTEDSIKILTPHREYLDKNSLLLLIKCLIKKMDNNESKINQLFEMIDAKDEEINRIREEVEKLKDQQTKQIKYENALDLIKKSKWEESYYEFNELEDYKDSREKKLLCKLEMQGLNSLSKDEQMYWWSNLLTNEWRQFFTQHFYSFNNNSKIVPDEKNIVEWLMKLNSFSSNIKNGMKNFDGFRYLNKLGLLRLCWTNKIENFETFDLLIKKMSARMELSKDLHDGLSSRVPDGAYKSNQFLIYTNCN